MDWEDDTGHSFRITHQFLDLKWRHKNSSLLHVCMIPMPPRERNLNLDVFVEQWANDYTVCNSRSSMPRPAASPARSWRETAHESRATCSIDGIEPQWTHGRLTVANPRQARENSVIAHSTR